MNTKVLITHTFKANAVTSDGGNGIFKILVAIRGRVDGALFKVYRDSSVPEQEKCEYIKF